MPTTDPGAQQAADDLEAVPGFRPLTDLEESLLENQAAPDPSTTSPRSPAPDSGPTHRTPPTSSTSSRTSTEGDGPDNDGPVDLDPEVDEALADLGAGVFHLVGIGANKFAQRRTHTQTRLWLATQAEAQSFGDALGRIAARRVPEELAGADSDGADLLVMGATALGYTMRNAAGISDETIAAAAAGVGSPPAPGGSPHSSESPPTPAEQHRTVQRQPDPVMPDPAAVGAVAATPEPPDVISPDI